MTKETSITIEDMIAHKNRFILRDNDGILYDGSFKTKEEMFTEFNNKIRKTNFDLGVIQTLFGTTVISDVDFLMYSRIPKEKQIDDITFDFIIGE